MPRFAVVVMLAVVVGSASGGYCQTEPAPTPQAVGGLSFVDEVEVTCSSTSTCSCGIAAAGRWTGSARPTSASLRMGSRCRSPEFMVQAPEFERSLIHSGIHLIKFWFSVSRAEQQRRFEARKFHPLKQWKLSPVDLASLDKWEEYTKAKEAMFFYTDFPESPWIVIKSDCKKRARLNAMRYVLNRIQFDSKVEKKIDAVDPLLVGRANAIYDI